MDFSFVVVSVPRTVAPQITLQLAKLGIPVLCETPPAKDLDGLIALNQALDPSWKVQIAEQYAFQPNHAARLNLAQSGRLGTVSQAQVSVAHDYHGISLLRHLLGLTYEDTVIQACDFESPLVKGPDFQGPPKEDGITTSRQAIGNLRFGDKLAVYDFTDAQYFSWVRSPSMLVRGDKGEINNFEVRYLHDYLTPIEATLRRTCAGHDGNLEGFYLKDILLGDSYLYRNPFVPGRWTDADRREPEQIIPALVSDIHAMVQRAKSNDIAPVICSILPTNLTASANDHIRNAAVRRTNQRLQAIATQEHVLFVDFHSHLVTEDGSRLPHGLADDGLHPHVVGYDIMARVLREELGKHGIDI